MVCTILDRTHQLGPQRSRNFYDDIVSRATGDHHRVVEGLGTHGVNLTGQIAAARLDVNTEKTVIGTSSAALTSDVSAYLSDRNIFIEKAAQTRDLGLGGGAGVPPPTKIQSCCCAGVPPDHANLIPK